MHLGRPSVMLWINCVHPRGHVEARNAVLNSQTLLLHCWIASWQLFVSLLLMMCSKGAMEIISLPFFLHALYMASLTPRLSSPSLALGDTYGSLLIGE